MEEKAEEMRYEENPTTIAGFEDEGAHEPKNVEWPLEAENNSSLTASKEMGTSLLQPHGTKCCQQCAYEPRITFSSRAFIRVAILPPWF